MIFERELQVNKRLEKGNRLEDERRPEEEIEAAIDGAFDAERDAACELLCVQPTAISDLVALLTHARDYDTDGMGWPDRLVDGDGKEGETAPTFATRSWQYFLVANLIEILPTLVPTRDKQLVAL